MRLQGLLWTASLAVTCWRGCPATGRLYLCPHRDLPGLHRVSSNGFEKPLDAYKKGSSRSSKLTRLYPDSPLDLSPGADSSWNRSARINPTSGFQSTTMHAFSMQEVDACKNSVSQVLFCSSSFTESDSSSHANLIQTWRRVHPPDRPSYCMYYCHKQLLFYPVPEQRATWHISSSPERSPD